MPWTRTTRLDLDGDVNVYKNDSTMGRTTEFNPPIQVLDIPNEIKVDYSPIEFVRCNSTAFRSSSLTWKMGKEIGGIKSDAYYFEMSN